MKRIAKLLLVAALAAGAAAAQAGMGILWSTSGGWVVAAGGDPDSGPGVAASDAVTWQLVYAGPDGVANAVDLSAADRVGGDDVLLAERSIPAGGGTAADGTSWDDWLIQQGGDATYVDLDWSADRDGYVFQRIFQGTPSEGTPYAESGLFAFDPAFAREGAPPDNFSFPGDGGFVLDRTIPTTLKTYPLWVGGVQVCETNKNNILGDGTAWFVPSASGGTLSLSNATITATYAFEDEWGSSYSANVLSGEGFDLTISLTGTNILQNAEDTSGGRHDYGVRSRGNLAITGGGALVAGTNYDGAGIDTDGDLLVDGADVTAHSEQYGISVGGGLAISNAVVTAYGVGYGGISGGDGDIDIADSVVTATGWAGIEAHGHTVTVSGASVVTAEATWDEESEWALGAEALVLRDGLAVTEPSEGAFDADEWCVIDPATGAPALRVVIDRRFAVTVEGGSTTNTTARAGETVTVVANAPEEGKAFVEWSPDDVNDVSFAPAAAATTTFTMPARAVTVTAVFKEIQIDSIPDQEWTGGPVEPEFRSDTVKFEGTDMVLLPGTDYTVSFTNNVDPGTATATVTMAPPRTGHASVTFQILPPPEPPAVSNVVARQRWPWNGLVDVDYEVGGTTTGLVTRISFAEQGGAGRSWVASNFLAGAEPSAAPGPHRATWDTAADGATNVVAAEVVATVALVREEPIVYNEFLYEIGGESAWSVPHPLYGKDRDGKYLGYYYLNSEFKFRPNAGDWNGDYEFAGEGRIADNGGANCPAPEPSFYRIQVDLAEGTYALEAVRSITMVGTHNSWNVLDLATHMSFDLEEGCWTIDYTFAEQTSLKFAMNDDWTVSWGGANGDASNYGDLTENNGKDLSVASGKYRIKLYLSCEGSNRVAFVPKE